MIDDDDDPSDISPAVGYLRSLRMHEPHYPLLLAEAVDNALDVEATEIRCLMSATHISVEDNGPGVDSARQKVFFQLGLHNPIIANPIGRYGMGMKVQAIAAGAVLKVVSNTPAMTFANQVNWDGMIKADQWRIGKPILSSKTNTLTGTVITIRELDRAPTRAEIARSRAEVIKMFFPALETRHIDFNGERLSPPAWPAMTAVIEQNVFVRPGKGAHVRAGLLVVPGGIMSQSALIYKHRALKTQTDFGLGMDYNGLTGMFARIDLLETADATWKLHPFKNGLKDPDADALEDAIEELLRPILERCHSASIDVAADELAEELTASLPPELHPARPRKKAVSARIIDLPTGRKSRSGITKDRIEDGPARSQRTPFMRIDLVNGLHRTHGVGKYEPGRKLHRIELSRDNPWMAFWLARYNHDREATLSALRMAAFAIYFYEKDCVQNDVETFGQRLSRLLERQLSVQTADERE